MKRSQEPLAVYEGERGVKFNRAFLPIPRLYHDFRSVPRRDRRRHAFNYDPAPWSIRSERSTIIRRGRGKR